ncbi:hypothetical protein E3N88_40014 [Mikania micrantha]|uniref:Uncharacterized protein n=1 Tax=Mikania micrantha TaxID=192012 RepID=A0A5N6LLK1_9ASTR|nr:hypothetical protein E3N88_40014 [Mikania micrantha]
MGTGNDLNPNQVHSMDVNGDSSSEFQCELGSFEHQVFRQFRTLSAASDDEILSLNWVSRLLDAFIACQEDFKLVMSKHKSKLSIPPLDRFVTEFFDMIIKALDICNAVRDGMEKIRLWHRHLEIVSNAFDSKSKNIMFEGHFKRAKRGLTDLAIIMFDDNKESSSAFAHRNRSFGCTNKGKDNEQSAEYSRSLSWSVPNSWSASKQLQLIANRLIPPKGHEILATNGLANDIYTMGFILMFVLWVLVRAIPCQDRSLQVHFSVPRQFSWGTPLNSLHIRIMEEFKKHERKNNVGLLKEIGQMEKSIHLLTGLVDSVNQFPLTEKQMEEVKTCVQEVSLVCDMFKNGLEPLELQLRDVFRKILSCRTKGLEIIKKHGFIKNQVDQCTYFKVSGSNFAILVLYVDDILLTSNSIDLLHESKRILSRNFDMKDLDEASYVIGIEIHRDRAKGTLGLSQKAYIDRVLTRTKDNKLTYRRNNNLEVIGYSDSDFAKCKDDKKSASGYIFKLAGGPISWKSHKQQLTTTSKMMAEYVAVYNATCHGMLLRNLIAGLKVINSISRPLKIYCDNSATVSFSNSNSLTGAGLYLDTKFLFVRERVEENNLCIEYINTKEMLADPMTKGLPPKVFQELVMKMGFVSDLV